MAEYIEREALIQELDAKLCALHGELDENRIVYDAFTDGFEECVGEVGKFQFAADLAQVVHGRWIESKEHLYLQNGCKEWKNFYCSECDAPNNSPTNYCPNCGAKMDGDN